jgi:PAS domain S-box-containing protein
MNSSRRYPINTQIILIFLLFTALLIITAILNHITISRFYEGTNYLRNHSVEQLSLVNSIQQTVSQNKIKILHHLLNTDPSKKELYAKEIFDLKNQNDNNYDALSKIAADELLKEKLTKVLRSRLTYWQEVDSILELSTMADFHIIAQFEEQVLRPSFNSYNNELNEFIGIVISDAEEEIALTAQRIENARKISNMILISGLVILLSLAVIVIRIVKRLKADYTLLLNESEERERAQKELKLLNEQLEERVEESTKHLRESMRQTEISYGKLKEANDELSALKSVIDLSDNPIIIRDPKDGISFWNKGAEKFYGCSKNDAMGKNCENFIEREFNEPYDEIMNKIKAHGFWHGEIRFKDKNTGEESIVSSGWKMFKSDKGEPLAILEIDHDITRRKEMEEEVRRYNRELLDINSAKDKIFSVLSHDLRNPVAGLVSASEVLMKISEDSDPLAIKQFSEIINRTAVKLLEQLNDLVVLAKKLHRKSTYNPKNLHLCIELNRAYKLIKAMAEKKNIRFENKISEYFFVYADPFMLRSIFQNLITNAIKFTPQEGHILITAHDKHEFIEVNISDTGIGMPEEVSSNLFNTSIDYSKQTSDSGLGLILVKDFIMRHGGHIKVDSAPDKGTTICFTLPKADNEASLNK